jgi:hypothetical protein
LLADLFQGLLALQLVQKTGKRSVDHHPQLHEIARKLLEANSPSDLKPKELESLLTAYISVSSNPLKTIETLFRNSLDPYLSRKAEYDFSSCLVNKTLNSFFKAVSILSGSSSDLARRLKLS